MKKIKSFVAGVIFGVSAALMSVWHWEKQSRKKFSTVADKFLKQSKAYVNELLDEYGPVAAQKVDEIKSRTQEYLEKTLGASKKDVKKIMEQVSKYIEGAVAKLGRKKAK